jgi:hypothetical protein
LRVPVMTALWWEKLENGKRISIIDKKGHSVGPPGRRFVGLSEARRQW